MRAVYNENDAMPIKFFAVEDQPDTYHLRNEYPGQANRYITFDNGGHWLYATATQAQDASPVKFSKHF